MSEKSVQDIIDEGMGPAFPTENGRQTGENVYHFEGMTLRDYFAAKAMNGMLGADGQHGMRWVECVDQAFQKGGGNWMNPEGVATKSYELADAMIAARKPKEIK